MTAKARSSLAGWYASLPDAKRQFLTFCLIGITSIAIDWTLTYVFVYRMDWAAAFGEWASLRWERLDANDVSHWIAKFAAVSVATVNGFVWNSRFTFRHYDRSSPGKRFATFATVIGAGLLLNSTLMTLVLMPFEPPPGAVVFWSAQAVSTGVVTFWNFFASKYWTFRSVSAPPEVY